MFVHEPALLHIDMDAFFASVEQARRPELRGLPVIVGGEAAGRGVVSAASYEARRFGVHSAMPITQAERLCPQGVFLPVDMKAYVAVRDRLVELYNSYTDAVENVSIDEAFLDVAGSRRLFGPPRTIACRIQEQVRTEHDITCTIGIGPTKLLAKLASNLNKPAGIGELTEADVHGRLRELPVRELWGIGPVTEQRLVALGLSTVGMLQDVPLVLLTAAFGRGAHGLRQLAFGRGSSSVSSHQAAPKSLGREVTLREDTNDAELLLATLLLLTDDAVARLRTKGFAARTITLKVRYSTFLTITRRLTLARATTSTHEAFTAVKRLFAGVELEGRFVRLVGVTLSGLLSNAFQLSLDDHWREVALNDAVDRVRAKYGKRALRLAASALTPAFHPPPTIAQAQAV
jgi:nucleotidyltransferase/DNA polymerase involved in DNA repair